jgi:hypothetical protein
MLTTVSAPGGMKRVDNLDDLTRELRIQSRYRTRVMLEGDDKASKWIKKFVSAVSDDYRKMITAAMGVDGDVGIDELVAVLKREAEHNFFVTHDGTTYHIHRDKASGSPAKEHAKDVDGDTTPEGLKKQVDFSEVPDEPGSFYANVPEDGFAFARMDTIEGPAEAWIDKHGYIHRDGDRPAVIYGTGRVEYMDRNAFHRVRGPAVINPDGSEEDWIKGKLVARRACPGKRSRPSRQEPNRGGPGDEQRKEERRARKESPETEVEQPPLKRSKTALEEAPPGPESEPEPESGTGEKSEPKSEPKEKPESESESDGDDDPVCDFLGSECPALEAKSDTAELCESCGEESYYVFSTACLCCGGGLCFSCHEHDTHTAGARDYLYCHRCAQMCDPENDTCWHRE